MVTKPRKRGAPFGNKNATKNLPWRYAIEKALEKRTRLEQKIALEELAEKFLATCDGGDIAGFRELGDRLDGKPNQPISADMAVTVQIVRFTDES